MEKLSSIFLCKLGAVLLTIQLIPGYSFHSPSLFGVTKLISNELQTGTSTALNSQMAATASVKTRIGSYPDSELSKTFDCIVIGGGPAGVAGALRAAQLGKRVLIVDKPKAAPAGGGLDPFFGGPTGLFSKALRDCGKTIDLNLLKAQRLDDDVIWLQVRNSCVRLATNNAETVLDTLERFKVGYLQGEAKLESFPIGSSKEGAFELGITRHDNGEFTTARAKNVLMCLGSKATRLNTIPYDGLRVFDADSINGLSFLPKSVAIVGSGIIACEYAKIFRLLKADVTMLVRNNAMDALQRIGLDRDLSKGLLESLAEDGIKVLEYTSIDEIEKSQEGPLKITLTNGDTFTKDILLAATGRIPSTKNNKMGLSDTGVEMSDFGHIVVDKETLETNVPGLFAAGDCVDGPGLASTGVDQAQRAVDAMFDSTTKLKGGKSYPIGMWTIPEIGYYGLTKEEAIAKGYDAEEGIARYDQCLRGRVFAPNGILKLVFDTETSKILGVHVIGQDACELVHFGMGLVDNEVTIFDVIATLYTAVTFHELFKEAALNGNSKLEFGLQWQDLLNILAISLPDDGSAFDEAEIRRRFDEIDENGDGSLDEDELLEVFQKFNPDVPPTAIATLVYLADDDENGTIEWDEFLKIFQVINKHQKKVAKKQAEELCLTEVDTVDIASKVEGA